MVLSHSVHSLMMNADQAVLITNAVICDPG